MAKTEINDQAEERMEEAVNDDQETENSWVEKEIHLESENDANDTKV